MCNSINEENKINLQYVSSFSTVAFMYIYISLNNEFNIYT